MIPRIIHYCWFGRNPKPKLAKKCIKSWKRKCKDYTIIEWNEDNFDISECPLYVQQAYEEKKWAFVTDYVRLKVVYDNGGVYFDTDVQVIKSIDALLNYNSFFGFEDEKHIATGLGFGAEKKADILKEIMSQYEVIPFLLDNGDYDRTPCPIRNTEVFKEYGLIQDGSTQILKDNIIILSPECLCPISFDTLKMNKTKNTYSIHWFGASWYSKEEHSEYKRRKKEYKRNERKYKIKTCPNKIVKRMIGETRYQEIKTKIKRK